MEPLKTRDLGHEVINSIDTTAPSNEPVEVSDFKTYAKIDYSTEDSLITSLLKASRSIVEAYIKRKTTTSTVTVDYDETSNRIYLPYLPIISVTSVKVLERDDTETDLTADTDYYVNGDYIEIEKYGRRLEIVYDAGYGANASDVPEGIKTAIKELTLQAYDQRGEYEQRPTLTNTVKILLHPYRRITI